MNQEIVSNRKKHCSICHYPIPDGSICRLCESKKQWLEDKEYFCTSHECGRFLPGATKPGLCDVCRQVAAEPVAPPKQTLKSEKQPKAQENQSMEKPESCAKCGNRLTKNGFCRRCAVKNGTTLRKKSPAESPESVAPETGAKEPVCNETDSKVTQEKSNVTFEPAANTIHASPAPRPNRNPHCHICGAIGTPEQLTRTSKGWICPTCAGKFDKPVIHIEESDVCRRAILQYGMSRQIIKAAEEFAEAAAVINRHLALEASVDEIAGELADVEIMCVQMRLILGDDVIDAVRAEKVARLHGRLKP